MSFDFEDAINLGYNNNYQVWFLFQFSDSSNMEQINKKLKVQIVKHIASFKNC